ncbi:MAG TPA: lipopolysaccharide heptosyltransferase II [Candidatus Paceibacterota bacterium]|nr:lipopolysaccharide heptosyltransferase II [Verrucomicrobiota bacterium]HSA12056.1 lipopolysaccharide heptosyltransferase II [Candidatus Paceibacterota bacterium]
MKILILKPSSLGDVVHALPVLRLIKRHLPGSEVHWWIDSNLAPLLEGDPDLASVVRFERQRWASPRHWAEMWRSVRWLRRQCFDWVIDLQSLLRSGVFAWLANGRLSIGLDEPREGARGFYDHIVRRPSALTHAADWYLRVLPILGVPVDGEVASLPERPAVAESVRRKWPAARGRWIILQPGARWPTKRWPVESFTELVRLLAPANPEFQFAVLGGEDGRPLGEAIAQAAPARCLDLTGRLSLPEMVEWIRLAELMVSNDTGPLHVAAALGKPVVALFGPTEPRRTGPYRQLDHVLQLNLPCVPCFKQRCRYVKPFECLRAIPPAAVFEAVQKRLGQA